jgi:4-hydroxyphenylpyruvate dioxygenase
MANYNPAGLDGFDFLEFTTTNPALLNEQFQSMGFVPVAKHRHHDVTLYQQNDIRFIVNNAKNCLAERFAKEHGASACAMGFRVANAKEAFDHAVNNGATVYQPEDEAQIYPIPAIVGVGGSLIYFVEYTNDMANYADQFEKLPYNEDDLKGSGLTYIDHVTHNLFRGNMDKLAGFYERVFNFREIRYFDIEGKVTGLKSRAMTSPCEKIRIPLNESADDQSQIEEFLRDFHGEGIQHIALGTDAIYETVEQLQRNGLGFLDTPDTYYELIEKRLPGHGESVSRLQKNRILIDGNTHAEKELLLQIFTKNMLGPVFFEIIQRKGDQGFGEGNFRALFESIELDQIQRGVIKVEKEV